MKYITILAIIISLLKVGWSCRTIEELDECAYSFDIISNPSIPIPTNDQEVQTLCSNTQSGLKCLNDEAKECAKGSIKAILVKVITDLTDGINHRCADPGERTEFARHIQCFHDDTKAAPIRNCVNRHIAMMERVSTIDKSLRLGGGCCGSHYFRKCIIDTIQAGCGGDSADYFNEMIEAAVGQNMELMCKELSDIGKCDAKYDQTTWTELKAIMDSNEPIGEHQYKTLIPIIIKMLKEA
ncbi:hypothetical protein HUG17_6549 [Dermatophagoides farinae]|nr:uncharacterized protein LOC124493370 [Dermatophagoides farinae]KAH7644187.1 hypothetical protein HUG17_6549 [Dermatophagoides farinae]